MHSQAAFKAMDRNKDGFITKGELKLAKKKLSMKEIDSVILFIGKILKKLPRLAYTAGTGGGPY